MLLLGVTILISGKYTNTTWILLGILLFAFLLFSLLTSRLFEIHLDRSLGRLTLSYKNHISIKRTVSYDLKQIEFTYKRQATSFRGGIKNVCTLYHSDKKVIQIIPDNDDWDENEIRNIVSGLIEAGVKKKFIGYSLKDVEM